MCDENFISQKEELRREAELIFRGSAFQVIADNCRTDQMTLKCYDKLLEGIGNIPAADVVEVIRCKDCKYWASTLPKEEHDDLAMRPHGDGVCDYWESDGLGPNDYCSCAVSRGDADATGSC